MELRKQNIHMDRVRTQASTQFSLEEDLNIPDSKGDVGSLCLEKGEVLIEEIRPANNSVTVRGNLRFVVLYHTPDMGGALEALEGQIPFEEKINLQNVSAADNVTVTAEQEDLTVHCINSRKLGIRALVMLNARVEDLYDEELPTQVEGEDCEYHREAMEVARLAICKKDVLRLKDEVTLPSAYPNIYKTLWESVSLRDITCKVGRDKISVTGEIHLFLLYEGEGMERPIRTFETTLPIDASLECDGAGEGMIPDICYQLGQKEVIIKPDFDGEERCVELDLSVDLSLRLYEEETMEIISDLYGITSEIETVTKPAALRKLLSRVTGKVKLTGQIPVPSGAVLQLLHSEGKILGAKQKNVENGICLQGMLFVKVLYVTGVDATPYACAKAQIPYEYTLEVPGLRPQDQEVCPVCAQVEQLQVTMAGGEEMDVKAIMSFSVTAFQSIPIEVICDAMVGEADRQKLAALPGMVIYVVKEGDNLWNIGKRYYVPVATLREVNGLQDDTLQPGQKLLIVRGNI